MQRRKYSAQLKAEAVRMVTEDGKPARDVGTELDVYSEMVKRWVWRWRRESSGPLPLFSPSERTRMVEMEDEICRLRAENEHLRNVASAARAMQQQSFGVTDGVEASCPVHVETSRGSPGAVERAGSDVVSGSGWS